jgi:hypothetical protein
MLCITFAPIGYVCTTIYLDKFIVLNNIMLLLKRLSEAFMHVNIY